MATTSKIYKIEIALGQAQTELNAATAKLEKLQKQLAGLSEIDKKGSFGQAIKREMDAAGAAIEQLDTQITGLEQSVKTLTPAAGSIGALRQEFRDLSAELNTVAEGSAEANRILTRLGDVKGSIKGLRDEVKALDPEKRIQAFNSFAQGVVGAFGVATVAAETFGLSSTAAEEFTKKTQGVIAVLTGLEGIRNALDGETIKSIKSTYALAKAYLTAGEGAQTGGKMTRAAMIGTGIGILIVALGIVAANFDKIKEVAGEIYLKFKPAFDAIGAVIGTVIAKARDLASFLTFGLVDDAAKNAQKVAADSMRLHLAQQAEQTARLLDILKARGNDTLALEIDNARRLLLAQKAGSKEALDAARDYDVLKAQLDKRTADETKAARVASLNALATVEAARGKETFAQQLAVKQEQLAQLLAADRVNEAAVLQQQADIDALREAHDKTSGEKRRALLTARLQAELTLRTAKGGEEFDLQIAQNEIGQRLAAQNLATIRAAAQLDRAAEVTAIAEAGARRLELLQILDKRALSISQEYGELLKSQEEGRARRAQEAQKKHDDTLARMKAGATAQGEDAANEAAARLQALANEAANRADIGGNLLVRLFGLTPGQLEKTKQAITEAFSSLSNSVGAVVGPLLAAGIAAADEAIQSAQNRLSELDRQLSEVSSARQADEISLAQSAGARRDFLISRIQKEKAVEQQLAAEKAAAAKAEETAAKNKAALMREQQAISAASTVIESVLLSVKAATAVVEAASKGKIGWDNIALAIAAAAAIGSSIFTVRNAVKSMGDGGIIEGGSHASGNDVPVFGGKVRVEGGEGILPVDATANNRAAFELLRTKGRRQTLTLADFAQLGNVRVLPPPAGMSQFGAGGTLPGGAGAGGGQVQVSSADLSELLDTQRAMLAHITSVAQATAATASYGPASLQIGPYEATRIELERQKAVVAESAATL